MATKYPYISGPGVLIKVFSQFRKSLPRQVDAKILKKLALAPNNESYVLNTLRFLGIIGEDGETLSDAKAIFFTHDDAKFGEAMRSPVKKAYSDLFELHGDETWNLELDLLISFFRQTDQTSEIVGKRQAKTFQTLAALSGFGDLPQVHQSTSSTETKKPKTKTKSRPKEKPAGEALLQNSDEDQALPRKSKPFALTVRLEINLPSSCDKETYDSIFRSIRENLINVP